MMLGDLLHKFDDPSAADIALLQLGDLALLAAVDAAAAGFGETRGEYAAASVARFSGEAKDDDWTDMMSAIARAENPGAICFRKMIEWAVAQDRQHESGCGCGHGHAPAAGAIVK
jgi:hypothetical protein